MIHGQLPEVIVEHVGSTAVPGCAGKGAIDLLVPYREGELEPVKEILEQLGFQRQSTTEIRLGSTSTSYPQARTNPTSFALSATCCAMTLRCAKRISGE
jgi:GrpB-like predicted nucleotidyltransferase (UPF0157 family)